MPSSQTHKGLGLADKTKQHRVSVCDSGWSEPPSRHQAGLGLNSCPPAGLQAIAMPGSHEVCRSLSPSFPATLSLLEPTCLTLPWHTSLGFVVKMGLFLHHPLTPYALRTLLSMHFLHLISSTLLLLFPMPTWKLLKFLGIAELLHFLFMGFYTIM